MNPINLNPLNPWPYVATLILVLATGFAAQSYRLEVAEKEAALVQSLLNKERADHQTALAAANAKTLETERKLHDSHDAQEVKDRDHEKAAVALSKRISELAAAGGGRLRDPNAVAECPGSPSQVASNADDRTGDATAATGLFSAEASGLLVELTEKADAINRAYISCRADAQAVRSQ